MPLGSRVARGIRGVFEIDDDLPREKTDAGSPVHPPVPSKTHGLLVLIIGLAVSIATGTSALVQVPASSGCPSKLIPQLYKIARP
jgi:hypothetical protein